MEDLIKTFHIDYHLIIAQIVNFLIVLAVLYFFALKPVVKLLTEREKKISKSLKDAEEVAQKLEDTDNDYNKKIAQAKKEAQEIIDQATITASVKQEEMISNAKNDVESIISAGKSRLAEEKNKMLDEVRQELADLVIMTTEKVLRDVAREEIDKKVIKQKLDEIK